MKTIPTPKQPRELNSIVRLIRRKNSPQYFAMDGWTTDPEQALLFDDSVEAAQTCIHYGLTDVGIALRVSGGTSDIFFTQLR